MKKSPSLEELEFSGKKDTNRSRSEKKMSPDRLDTDEPLESCTEDMSRQQSESVKRYEQPVVINSPVQFQMMQESDVKVQDTSDDANSKLMIRDH